MKVFHIKTVLEQYSPDPADQSYWFSWFSRSEPTEIAQLRSCLTCYHDLQRTLSRAELSDLFAKIFNQKKPLLKYHGLVVNLFTHEIRENPIAMATVLRDLYQLEVFTEGDMQKIYFQQFDSDEKFLAWFFFANDSLRSKLKDYENKIMNAKDYTNFVKMTMQECFADLPELELETSLPYSFLLKVRYIDRVIEAAESLSDAGLSTFERLQMIASNHATAKYYVSMLCLLSDLGILDKTNEQSLVRNMALNKQLHNFVLDVQKSNHINQDIFAACLDALKKTQHKGHAWMYLNLANLLPYDKRTDIVEPDTGIKLIWIAALEHYQDKEIQNLITQQKQKIAQSESQRHVFTMQR